MSRSSHQMLSIAGIIAVFAIFSLMSYYLGGAIEKQFIGNKMDINRWAELYKVAITLTGATTGAITLGWIGYAIMGKKITAPRDVDARTVWIFFGIGTLVAAGVVPNIYAAIKNMPFHIVLSLVLVFIYGLGFYACTLYGTPKKFKYTPIGAEALLVDKNA